MNAEMYANSIQFNLVPTNNQFQYSLILDLMSFGSIQYVLVQQIQQLVLLWERIIQELQQHLKILGHPLASSTDQVLLMVPITLIKLRLELPQYQIYNLALHLLARSSPLVSWVFLPFSCH